jgi:hypothetical protein
MATAVELLVTHYCMFAARPANAILPNRVDIGSARFGLTAAPQANIIASLHADKASVFVFMTAL